MELRKACFMAVRPPLVDLEGNGDDDDGGTVRVGDLWPRQLPWQPTTQHSEQQSEWSKGFVAWKKPEMMLRSTRGLVFSARCFSGVGVDPCVLSGLAFKDASWRHAQSFSFVA
jgi:hypothetical protein